MPGKLQSVPGRVKAIRAANLGATNKEAQPGPGDRGRGFHDREEAAQRDAHPDDWGYNERKS